VPSDHLLRTERESESGPNEYFFPASTPANSIFGLSLFALAVAAIIFGNARAIPVPTGNQRISGKSFRMSGWEAGTRTPIRRSRVPPRTFRLNSINYLE